MNMKSNMRNSVEAKFHVKMRKILAIIALVAVIGFLTACDDEDNGAAPTITTTTLPYGTVGVTYSITVAATGDSPITWSIESGEIPDGLTLSAGGVITGTPTTAKTYTFTIKATNIAGKDTKSLSITTDIPPTQTSVGDFEDWLEGQPANTASTPYGVKLNLGAGALNGTSDDDGSVGKVIKDSGKYVSVDLSGSTFNSIGDNAFQNCTNLISIIIPNTVANIGASVFFDCGITSVTLPTNNPIFTTINEIAFCFCTNLTSITIPASVTDIGDHAFFASGLTSIRFESDSTTFSSDAFVNGVNTKSLLTAYSDDDGGVGTYTRQNTSSTTWTKEKS